MEKTRRPLAFVIHDLNPWGGHDRSTLEIARRLSHRWPVDVYAYSLEDPEGRKAWGEVRFHRIRPSIHRPNVAKLLWFYGATLPPLRVLPSVKGAPLPLVHSTGTCTLVSDVVNIQFLSAAWKAKQSTLPEDVCARPFARGVKGPRAWVRNRYHDLLLDYNAAIEHRVYTQDKTYIAIARSVADELRDFFGLIRNVHVIRHGVDSKTFAPPDESQLADREALRRELGVREGELVVAFVGAYERKGLAVAIDALARLAPQELARVRLMAVGGGAIEGFRERAIKSGVGDRVILVGHQKDIPRYYRASDLFVLPTLYEPFGLVILEAMAAGLAPVVSRLAGASELIRDGESGILIDDPSSPEEVARHLSRLVGDEGLRRSMSDAARKVAVARSWDQVAREYEEVLAPLLGREC